MSSQDNTEREYFLKGCLLKDLRVECRNRGINPAGNRDTLVAKLNTAMAERGETAFGRVNEPAPPPLDGVSKNNYTRPEGQNVGNFVTGRNSSRVTAPPGGKSSVHFFGGSTPSVTVEDRTRRSMSPPVQQAPVEPPPNPPAPTSALPPKSGGLNLANNEYAAEPEPVGVKSSSNNYTRPGGRQNVGNYITGRNTSRVLAPPGGGSSVSFG